MEREILQNIWNFLTSNGMTNTPFEEWVVNIQNSDAIQKNIHSYLIEQNVVVNDFDTWANNLGLKKKVESEIVPEPVPEVVMDSPMETGLSGLSKIQTSRRVPTQQQLESPGEQETFLSRTFGNVPILGEIIDTVEDMATYVEQGLGQGSTLNEALEVMAKGSSATTQDVQDYIEAVKKMESIPVTDEMKDFAKIYNEGGKTVGSFLKGLLYRPSVAPGIILQSFANYLNPTAVAGGLAGAGTGAAIGAAGTFGFGAAPGALYGGLLGITGTLESGLSFTEFLKEEIEKKGLGFDDEGIAAVLNDEDAISRVRARTAGRGAAISVVNAFTAGIAGQVQRAGKKLTRTARNLARAGVEATGGGLGEVAGRAVAGQEMDVAEIGFEAIGEVGSPEAVIPILNENLRKALDDKQKAANIAQYKINGEVVSKENLQEIARGADVETFQNIEIEVINDPEVQQEIIKAEQRALIASNIKKVIPNVSVQDLNTLVDLQLQLTALESNDTQVAKDKIPEVKNQIKKIEDNYAIQEPSTETIPVPKQPETSTTVGEGDTQGAVPTGETPSEETQATQPGEEVTTEVEIEESQVEPALTQEDLLENETLEEGEHAEDKGIVYTRTSQVTEKDGLTTTKFLFNRSDKDKSQRGKAKVSEKALEKRGYQIDQESKESFEEGEEEGVIITYEVTEIRESESGAAADVTVTYTRPDGTQDRITGGVTLEPFVETEQVTAPLIKIEPGTQTEQVTQLLEQRGELSISEAANELGILEPNVRRIFGVGTKEGVFERVDKGVYTLTQGDKTYAVIEADAVDGVNTLIQKKNEGKFDGVDAVYLDPPYEVKSKNRNIADFAAITPKEFDNLIKKLPSILKNDDSVVMLQYTQAKQPQNVKERKAYIESLKKQGFKFALGISKTNKAPKKIVYKKMSQDMKKERFFAGRNIKEDIFVLTRTGMLPENFNINFAEEGGNYVLSYPMVDIRTKKFREFKGDTKKSVPAMEDLVETFVPEDGIILDPYVGVGTTISAAITKGREAIGIELDPKKAAKARRVIERKTKKTKPTQTKPEPKKTLQKEAPKKVKQIVPEKPKEAAPEPVLEDAVQEAVNNISPGFDRITKAKIVDNLDNFASKAKTLLREPDKRNVKLEKLRSTPGPYFDQALGINNSTAVYDNTSGELAREYGVYEGVFEKITTIVRDSQDKIAFSDKSKRAKKFGIERARNAQLTDALLVGLYMDVRQAELNKLPNGEFRDTSPDPVAMLNISIQNNPAPEARTLQKFKDKYVKDGQIKSEDILKDMTPTQKSVLKDLDKLNTELEPLVKEIYERQGRDFEPIKGYFHRLVIPKSNEADRVKVLEEGEKYGDRNFRAETTIDRVKGVKPINYNPFISVLRAYQKTLLDYYVTPAADKVQDITEAIVEKYKNGNEGQKEAARALDLAIKNNLETIYVNSYMGANNLNIRKQISAEINKNMYRAMLSSGPRYGAELLGNYAMYMTQSPKVVKDAYSKYKNLTMNKKNDNKYKDVLINLKSSEGRKVAKRRSATNKMIDVNDYLNLGQTEKAMINNPVFEKMQIISQYGPKQYYNKVMNIADDLMGGADKVVTRPMWASRFANEFIDNVKKYNNEDIDITLKDFDEIADGTSKYLKPEYKKARDEAVRKADRMVVSFVTSGNPVNAIIKNRPTRKGGSREMFLDYYRMVNSYMANFNLNEYAQARFAVGAMLKSGYMTKKEAAATLGALLARMSSYVILYRLMGDWMDALLGAPEEEEEDPLEQQIARQLVGSVATLLFRGGLGNIPSLPINFGIELLNEKYLESLRNGEPYNSYDNSIVFSLVTLDTLENKSIEHILISIASGRYGPAVKSIIRAGDLALRATGVTRTSEEAQARAAEELLNRMFLQEFIGLLGYMPFYKDVRRQSLKKRFDEGAGGMSASELKKQNRALYDLIYGD